MSFNPDNPSTWPRYNPLIIAHDVGRTRDRSTAVVGGNSPYPPRLLGIEALEELPCGLFGSARASALAAVDRHYYNNALIVADLSNDPTYAEVLFDTFGRRVIGLHISRHGDGMNAEMRPVKHGAIPVYTVGRSYLLELYHSELQARQVRIVDSEMSRRAYDQLATLETEYREGGVVYTCPSGLHDDLAISCAMLAWAARHPHLRWWINVGLARRYPPQQAQSHGWGAFV